MQLLTPIYNNSYRVNFVQTCMYQQNQLTVDCKRGLLFFVRFLLLHY